MLRNRFLQIYVIARHKNISIKVVNVDTEGPKEWHVEVVKNLNDWEINECKTLPSMLESTICNEGYDQLVWKFSELGISQRCLIKGT